MPKTMKNLRASLASRARCAGLDFVEADLATGFGCDCGKCCDVVFFFDITIYD